MQFVSLKDESPSCPLPSTVHPSHPADYWCDCWCCWRRPLRLWQTASPGWRWMARPSHLMTHSHGLTLLPPMALCEPWLWRRWSLPPHHQCCLCSSRIFGASKGSIPCNMAMLSSLDCFKLGSASSRCSPSQEKCRRIFDGHIRHAAMTASPHIGHL